jgi:DNA-binding MarR family transcriptional regulator
VASARPAIDILCWSKRLRPIDEIRALEAGLSTSSDRSPVSPAVDPAARLRDVIGKLYRRFRQNQDGDLTPAQLSVMATVETSAPIRLGDLAEREGVQPSTLSRTVSWLIEHDLLERCVSDTDKRSATVTLTSDGAKLMELLRERRTAEFVRRIARLSPTDQATVARALPVLEHLLDSY